MSAGEGFAVEVGDALLPVRVRRHPAARRLRLRWDAGRGELKLTLPPRSSLARARDWVAGHGDWIARAAAAAPARVLVRAGATLPWGEGALTLAHSPTAPRTPRVEGARLIVGGPAEGLGRRVARWLAVQAREDFTARCEALAATAGVRVASVAVGDPRSRWGSCSSRGTLRFSWRLMMAPDRVRQAIAAHEVAHLLHLDHSPEFRAAEQRLAGASEPERARVWLRANGAALQRVDFG